ncbi:MAG: S1 RNA-binding domain-containing protein, partial [Pseudomonadota bacterium]
TEVNSGGIEVSTSAGAVGFIRKSDLSRDRDEQRPERFAVGEKVDAQIMSIDGSSRKLSLSIKALELKDEKQAMADYGSSDSGASLGDILGAAIRQKQEEEQGKPDE